MSKKGRRHSGRTRHAYAVTISPREGWGNALEVGGVVQSVSVPPAGVAGLDATPEGG